VFNRRHTGYRNSEKAEAERESEKEKEDIEFTKNKAAASVEICNLGKFLMMLPPDC